jgi:hypothetical protein
MSSRVLRGKRQPAADVRGAGGNAHRCYAASSTHRLATHAAVCGRLVGCAGKHAETGVSASRVHSARRHTQTAATANALKDAAKRTRLQPRRCRPCAWRAQPVARRSARETGRQARNTTSARLQLSAAPACRAPGAGRRGRRRLQRPDCKGCQFPAQTSAGRASARWRLLPPCAQHHKLAPRNRSSHAPWPRLGWPHLEQL